MTENATFATDSSGAVVKRHESLVEFDYRAQRNYPDAAAVIESVQRELLNGNTAFAIRMPDTGNGAGAKLYRFDLQGTTGAEYARTGNTFKVTDPDPQRPILPGLRRALESMPMPGTVRHLMAERQGKPVVLPENQPKAPKKLFGLDVSAVLAKCTPRRASENCR